jgi:hypothetical protein
VPKEMRLTRLTDTAWWLSGTRSEAPKQIRRPCINNEVARGEGNEHGDVDFRGNMDLGRRESCGANDACRWVEIRCVINELAPFAV